MLILSSLSVLICIFHPWKICVGLNSGSVVGTLDSLTYGFYDMLGDVASIALLKAEAGLPGQVTIVSSRLHLDFHGRRPFHRFSFGAWINGDGNGSHRALRLASGVCDRCC